MLEASIIIPTYNRSGSLVMTLRSLAALDYPDKSYEILVLDNGSTDDTSRVARSMISSHPSHNIRHIFEPIPGLLSGRHRGALEAKSDILIFVDDDIEAAPDWLNSIMETFQDPGVQLVGGPSHPKYEIEPPEWLEAFWRREPGHHECSCLSLLDLGSTVLEIDPNYVWGLNFAIRKSTLFSLGGFHPDCIPKHLQRFQGDGETGLTMTAKDLGFKALYQPKAMVHHVIPKERLTLEYFDQRMFYQGVCNSFTQIRQERLQSTYKHKSLKSRLLNSLGMPKRLVRYVQQKIAADPYRHIKQRFHASYLAGYKFHQDEVSKDPELLKWVLREDYWDYRLPFYNDE